MDPVNTPLPRTLRIAAYVVIAVSHLFLLAHSQEPLRLNVGDPWSEANVLSSMQYVREYGFLETSFTDILDVGPLTNDSYRYTHYPPLSEIIYGAISKYTGITTIGPLRLFAIAFSALAMFLLFHYVRRLYEDEAVALFATMLWSCNLLWMMYADMIHQAPVMQASAFLALWGLVRALDEPRPRYWMAAWVGSCATFLTSYDYWLFLPIAVLVTVYLRGGNLLRRQNIKAIALCASGCVVAIILKCAFVIGAVGWHEFVADLHFQFLERSTSHYEDHSDAVVPTLIRRMTMVFSPVIWPLVALHVIRLVRRSSRARFFADGTWLAIPALLFFAIFSQLSASQMLPSQVLLPFYAVGTALLVVQLLRGPPLARIAGIAIVVLAPIWSGFWLLRQERALLDTDGFAKIKTYLDEHDRNDYILCNLMQDGPIQAYLGRHYWPAFSSGYDAHFHLASLDLMARSGNDHFHVLFFKDPHTRMIDKSLWPVALPKRRWSLTGSHLFWPKKAERLIREYDALIKSNLDEVHAALILATPQMELYRVTRAEVLRAAYKDVPDLAFVDLGSFTSERHKLLGWSGQRWRGQEMFAVSNLDGHRACPSWGRQWCRSVLTKRGLITKGDVPVTSGELMMTGSRACDADVVVRLVRPVAIAVALNGVPGETASEDQREYRAHFAKDALLDGVNVIRLSFAPPRSPFEAAALQLPPSVATVELRQACH
ncbi:MAG: hypothetical protein JWP01_2315 [Myxococcales bacterium]|nr:hypothetical protein [Myxococcales bacterium]